MKRTKLSRWRLLPLRYKLAIYFIFFSAVMLVFLWIFQTVFLESCYTIIKQHQVSQCASEIIESIESGNNTSETINTISKENEMSVYVYDSSDELMVWRYATEFSNPSGRRDPNTRTAYKR